MYTLGTHHSLGTGGVLTASQFTSNIRNGHCEEGVVKGIVKVSGKRHVCEGRRQSPQVLNSSRNVLSSFSAMQYVTSAWGCVVNGSAGETYLTLFSHLKKILPDIRHVETARRSIQYQLSDMFNKKSFPPEIRLRQGKTC